MPHQINKKIKFFINVLSTTICWKHVPPICLEFQKLELILENSWTPPPPYTPSPISLPLTSNLPSLDYTLAFLQPTC